MKYPYSIIVAIFSLFFLLSCAQTTLTPPPPTKQAISASETLGARLEVAREKTETASAIAPTDTLIINTTEPSATPYSTSTEEPSPIPVTTIPPPPTNTPRPTVEPGFQIGKANWNSCGSTKIAIFPVTAVGGIVFSSGEIRVVDLESDQVLKTEGNNRFFHTNNTLCSSGETELPSNTQRFIVVQLPTTKPGKTYRAVVTLCTRNELKGDCFKRALMFER